MACLRPRIASGPVKFVVAGGGVAVEFLADHDGTRLVCTERGAFVDGLEDPAERERGTDKVLDALERFLAEETVR